MKGRRKDIFRIAPFHEDPEIHDRDPVGKVLDSRKVVGDEEIGDVVPLLQLAEQVDQ